MSSVNINKTKKSDFYKISKIGQVLGILEKNGITFGTLAVFTK